MSDAASLATLALQVLGKTTQGLTALRERAKQSRDLDIKDQISTLFDDVLELKDIVSRLLDENKALQTKLESEPRPSDKPKIKQVGLANYYYLGDEGPFCQPCYDGKEKLVVLTPPREDNGGIYRRCEVCGKNFWEKPVDETPAFVTIPGPHGWMR